MKILGKFRGNVGGREVVFIGLFYLFEFNFFFRVNGIVGACKDIFLVFFVFVY